MRVSRTIVELLNELLQSLRGTLSFPLDLQKASVSTDIAYFPKVQTSSQFLVQEQIQPLQCGSLFRPPCFGTSR